jgi:hypothetical protein
VIILGILFLVAGIVVLAATRFPHYTLVGILLVAIGAVLILVDALDLNTSNADAAFVLPFAITRWRDWRYELDKLRDRVSLKLAILMPNRLRMWVVVDCTNTARALYPHPTGYAGPDGLGYSHLYAGALRARQPGVR